MRQLSVSEMRFLRNRAMLVDRKMHTAVRRCLQTFEADVTHLKHENTIPMCPCSSTINAIFLDMYNMIWSSLDKLAFLQNVYSAYKNVN